MIKLLFILLTILAVLIAIVAFWDCSQPHPYTAPEEKLSDRIGHTYLIRFDIFAAFNVEDAKRLRDLIHEKDAQAVTVMVLQGRVILVKKGSLAKIEDIDSWNRVEKFRVRGNPSDLWVEIVMIP